MVNVELPIEANLVWQLGKDLLNMYIETEVGDSTRCFYFIVHFALIFLISVLYLIELTIIFLYCKSIRYD